MASSRRTSVASEKALEQLASLGMQVDAIEQESTAVHASLTAHTASPEQVLAYTARIAALNGMLEKLQFVGIDGVITSELNSGKTDAKANRKSLTQRAEAITAELLVGCTCSRRSRR
jgi:hypothetical protein